jgi:four helix bundle suffix protein
MTTTVFIPPHGGYKSLISYQRAVIVYDGTVRFCERFLGKYDRTIDQMTQAARSGKQNIIEGSQASGTSRETEIKLTNVARASLEELLEDYRDWLRNHHAPLWDKQSKEALYVRRLASGKIAPPKQQNGTDKTHETYAGSRQNRPVSGDRSHHSSHPSHRSHEAADPVFDAFHTFFDTRPPAVIANILICLIHQTNYLLDQQIKQLEQAFLESGGLRENMTRARLNRRDPMIRNHP